MGTFGDWWKRLRKGEQPAVVERTTESELKDWRIVRVDNPEMNKVVVFRLRMRRPPLLDIDRYRMSITIRWPFESATGIPPEALRVQQNVFDKAIDELTAMNDNSELVRVATGDGVKEWLFYAKDKKHFMNRFNELLSGHPRLPLEIIFTDDPKWLLWREVVEAVREKSHDAAS